MYEWMPYLKELFGATRSAERQAEQLVALAESFAGPPPSLPLALRRLSQVEHLEISKRLFVLPWLAGWLAHPTSLVRGRVRRLCANSAGETGMEILREYNDEQFSRSPERWLAQGLSAAAEIIGHKPEWDVPLPFRALPALREEIVGMAMLLGLSEWARAEQNAGSVDGVLEDFFLHPDRTELRGRLHAWAISGPVFLRFLVVRWMGYSGLSTSSAIPVDRLLRQRYEHDALPIIAVAAIEAYARTSRIDSPPAGQGALRFLTDEYRWVTRRSPAGPLRQDDLRTLSVGLMRGIGILALQARSPEARETIIRLLHEPSALRLDLFAWNFAEDQARRLLRVAVGLHRQALRVRIRPNARGNAGRVGFHGTLRISDPQRLLQRSNRSNDYWAFPIPASDAPDDPLQWTYQLEETWRVSPRTDDLLPLVTPCLTGFGYDPPDRYSPRLQTEVSSEVDARGWWMLEGARIAAALYAEPDDEPGSRTKMACLDYLTGLAIGVDMVIPDAASPIRRRLKEVVEQICMTELAHPDAVDEFLGAGGLTPLKANVLVSCAVRALEEPSDSPSQNWITRHRGALRLLARDQGTRQWLRAVAALVLRLHTPSASGAAVPEDTGVPDRDKLHEALPAAIVLASNEVVSGLAETLTAQPRTHLSPLDLAVCAEFIARSVASGTSASPASERAAALYLAAVASRHRPAAAGPGLRRLQSVLVRRRLLGAFASAGSPVEKGVRRLLDALLRTASSAELEFFMAEWRLAGRHLPRKDVYRHLVTMLGEGAGGGAPFAGTPRRQGPVPDDSLVLERRALRELCIEARELADDFYQIYGQLRFSRQLPVETHESVAFRGTVLPGWTTGPGAPPEIVATGGSLARVDDDLALRASDVVMGFVHHRPDETGLTGLAHYRPVAPGTVDFHQLPGNETDKRKAFEERLASFNSCHLIGRVLRQEDNGQVVVDLGVEADGVRRRIRVAITPPVPPPDSPVLIELRCLPPVVDLPTRFRLTKGKPSTPPIDVRRLWRADRLLLDRWAQAREEGRLPALCATVVEVRADKSTVLIDPGFKVWDPDRGRAIWPVARAAEGLTPHIGQVVVVEPQNNVGATSPAKAFPLVKAEAALDAAPLSPGQMVTGTLVAGSVGAGGVRNWSARIGSADLPVPRRELTADLGELLRLDTLPRTDPKLARINLETRWLRVLEDGKAASLLRVDPIWGYTDLLLAVASGQVEYITLVKRDADLAEYVVEVAPSSLAGAGSPVPGLATLATLARLTEGQVYFEGAPLPVDRLPASTRLRLTTIMGDREQTGVGPTSLHHGGREPVLMVEGLPDMTNAKLCDAFKPGDPVDIEIVDRGTRLEVRLNDPPFDGLPIPRVCVEAESEDYFRKLESSFASARVEGEWFPWSEDFRLDVGAPSESSLFLDRRMPERDVRELIELKRFDMLRHRPRFWPDRRGLQCDVGFLPVRLDPQLPYLVPAPLSAQEFRKAGTQIRVRTSSARPRPPEELGDIKAFTTLPWALGGGTVQGLVVGVPRAGGTNYTARWLVPSADIRAGAAAPEWRFEPPVPLTLGDLLRVARVGDREVLQRIPRQVYGTTLHTPLTPQEITEIARGERGTKMALLLRRPNPDDPYWLFSLAPSLLLRLTPDQISGERYLTQARQLDRVQFEFLRPAAGMPVVRIVSLEPGITHEAEGRQFSLQLGGRLSDGQFPCTLPAALFRNLPALQLLLEHSDLPLAAPDVLLEQLRKERTTSIACVLAGLRVQTSRTTEPRTRSELYDFRLVPDLVAPGTALHSRAEGEERVSAGEALGDRSRLSGLPGKVVSCSDGLGVELTDLSHAEALPLPLEEQTWLRFVGRLPRAGFFADFTLLREAKRGIFVSLRRNKPPSLGPWLATLSLGQPGTVVRDRPLFYVGRLSPEEILDCGLDDAVHAHEPAGTREIYLFEAGPGDTLFARRAQLRFKGEPFDPHFLHRGDVVREFRVCAAETEERTSGNDAEDEDTSIIDIGDVELGLRHDVERFHARKGVFIGAIRNVDGNVQITQLRGGLAQTNLRSLPPAYRTGRWRLILEHPVEGWPAWIGENVEPEDAYLKLVEVDDQHGTMTFRLLSTDEVFTLDNLVYVRAGTPRETDDTARLPVQSLDPRHTGGYSISDNRFSERRGRLHALVGTPLERIFLARVVEVEARPASRKGEHWERSPEKHVRLALTDVPARRFWYLLDGPECQVIVRPPFETTPAETLVVEFDIAVNVELPLAKLDGLRDEWGQPQPGDILLLRPDKRGYRVTITGFLHGHLHYLKPERSPTVLTKLWSTPERRQEKAENRRARPNCSIVGYSQLRGLCEINETTLSATLPIPQTVLGLDPSGRWVKVRSSVESQWQVGRLRIEPGGPVLVVDGEKHLIPWHSVTHRVDNASALTAYVSDLRWQNLASSQADAPEGIEGSDVIAARDPLTGEFSLTVQAEHPMPVDHLVEQFPLKRAGDVSRSQSRSFIVARAEERRLVLEAGLGRYAELPLELVKPLHGAQIRTDLAQDLQLLMPGDEVTLEPVASTSSSMAILPHFRITRVRSGTGRHFSGPFVTVIHRTSEGVVLGPGEGGLPGDRFEDVLDESDVVVDLNAFPRHQRYARLREAFAEYENRVVLRVTRVGRAGRRAFFQIGIRTEIESGRDQDPSWVFPDEQFVTAEEWQVRLLALGDGEGDWLKRGSELHLERRSAKSAPRLVRWDGNSLRRCFAPPMPGDSVVIVGRGAPEHPLYHVVGFEEYAVVWEEDPDDPLSLDQESARRELHPYLFPTPSAVLWATVEWIKPHQRQMGLTRRRQLAAATPLPGRIGRARVLGAITGERLLVDLLGTPSTLRVEDYCQPAPPEASVLEMMESANPAGRGIEVEVVREGGRLVANRVYRTIQHGEANGVVEASSAGGVLVLSAGNRIYVRERELGWCRLSPALIREIFPVGTPLRIAPVADGNGLKFSAVATRQVLEEVTALEDHPEEPILVTHLCTDPAERIAFVRSQSGLLLEVRLGLGEEMPEYTCAYYDRTDQAGHRILLRLDDSESLPWLLPRPSRDYVIDSLSPDLLAFNLREFRAAAGAGPASALHWINKQRALEPSARNLRHVAEVLHEAAGGAPLPLEMLVQAEETPPYGLGKAWQQACVFLLGGAALEEITPPARFAAGYLLLLADGPLALAKKALSSAVADELAYQFDAHFALAYALYVGGERQRATQEFRVLLARAWASAMYSLPVPIPSPPTTATDRGLWRAWENAVRHGNTTALREIVFNLIAAEPGTPESEAAALWLQLTGTKTGPTFDPTVEGLFVALHDAKHYGIPVHPRIRLFAALLCFARGDVSLAWAFLTEAAEAEAESAASPERDLARAWSNWLGSSESGAGDTFIDALIELHAECRMHSVCDPQVLSRTWELFRTCYHRWILAVPACRLVPRPPQDFGALRSWARLLDIEQVLPVLQEGRPSRERKSL